jgi:hypothetical protein
MSIQVPVNKTIQVKVRLLKSGKIVPKSFDWQGRTHYVFAQGRQWNELSDGKRLRCFLVQTQDLNSYELRWDPAEDEWDLNRAWLANLV